MRADRADGAKPASTSGESAVPTGGHLVPYNERSSRRARRRGRGRRGVAVALQPVPRRAASTSAPVTGTTSGNKIFDSAGNQVASPGSTGTASRPATRSSRVWGRTTRPTSSTGCSRFGGYNTLRIPSATSGVGPNVPKPRSRLRLDRTHHTDLQGSRPSRCSTNHQLRGLHRLKSSSTTTARGRQQRRAERLWYTSAYPESAWVNDGVTMANRYKNNSTVVA